MPISEERDAPFPWRNLPFFASLSAARFLSILLPIPFLAGLPVFLGMNASSPEKLFSRRILSSFRRTSLFLLRRMLTAPLPFLFAGCGTPFPFSDEPVIVNFPILRRHEKPLAFIVSVELAPPPF